jgi:hypothetical protein
MSTRADSRQQYNDLAHIMFDIMVTIIDLEFQYAESGDPELLIIIEYNGWLLEYWENQMFAMFGHYSFDLSLFLR